MTTDMPTLVAGEWREGADGQWLPVLDPADQRRVVARVPALTEAQVAQAYRGAERGTRIWRETDALTRGATLVAAARLLRERREAIAADLVAEMGKTLSEAAVEVTKAADFFEYYGGLARSNSGYLLNDARPATTTGVRFEPVGIVLAITPWNDPLLTPARKLAPALYAGNAVVLKPATETPLVALHLARTLLDAGLPPEVLSVVTGRGRHISAALLRDDRLAGVTFTGSNEVGATIRSELGGRNLRLQAELGGKNATAVMRDADLELAAATIASAGFAQAGQRCTATSRVIADRPIACELVDRIAAAAAGLALGPGTDPQASMGPVVSAAQQRTVLGHLRRAVAEGATPVSGGGIPPDERLRHGCFVEPTVLTGVTPDMAIWREEVFGPALVIVEADGFDDIVTAVNDSAFGLSAALFTTNLETAHRFVERADTGQVAVNLPTSGWDVHQPFGGFRSSGSAFKEQGAEALHFYSRAKTFAIRYA